MSLISDRTEKDYLAMKELSKIPWRKMNDGQKAQWSGFMKGRYTFEDLNRVESAVLSIASTMLSLPTELDEYGVDWDSGRLPYDPDSLAITTKTDWTVNDMFPSAERERYLGNVRYLRDTFVAELPLPLSMEGLTWEGANQIEAALIAASDAFDALKNELLTDIEHELAQFKLHSGEIYSGEV